MTEMRAALHKAKTAGFFRTILDIGPAASELARQCRQIEDDPEMTVYIDRFLERADCGAGKNATPLSTLVLQELTNRELDILKLLIAGSKNREICSALKLSENTVKWYLKRVYEKLGARNRTEAAMTAKTLFAAL
jgi:LuxR family maltose regulon positive regulatory protein